MGETGLTTLSYVNTVIRERPRQIHKGQCGRVLIVAGSVGMAGACVLSTGAAPVSYTHLYQYILSNPDLADRLHYGCHHRLLYHGKAGCTG